MKDVKCFFFFLATPGGVWDLSSRPGIEPTLPAVEAWSLNHWTAREVPRMLRFHEGQNITKHRVGR